MTAPAHTCPTCGGSMLGPLPLADVAARMPETMRRVLDALKDGRPRSLRQLADIVYDDDLNGGPDWAESSVKTTISHHRRELAAYGWNLTGASGRGYTISAIQRQEDAA